MALSATQYKEQFLASPEAKLLREQLERMAGDPSYHTPNCYVPGEANGISFVEKHLAYMSQHAKINTSAYMSNLRLMTRCR